jgi:uncharacterized protein (DUF4415 family)
MIKESIKRYKVDELRQLTKHEENRTDIARIEAMSDQDVEHAIANDPDWEEVPDNWHERAEAITPKTKVPISIRLDTDLVDHVRSTGRGWQTRINAGLR